MSYYKTITASITARANKSAPTDRYAWASCNTAFITVKFRNSDIDTEFKKKQQKKTHRNL